MAELFTYDERQSLLMGTPRLAHDVSMALFNRDTETLSSLGDLSANLLLAYDPKMEDEMVHAHNDRIFTWASRGRLDTPYWRHIEDGADRRLATRRLEQEMARKRAESKQEEVITGGTAL